MMRASRILSAASYRLHAALAVTGLLVAMPTCAQSTFASGTEIVLPLVANVGIYHSRVFVQNADPATVTLNVRYYQSNNATPPAGLRACAQVVLPGNQSASFDIGSQCSLTGTDDDFGMVILEDVAGTHQFFAYSRTQTPDGIGFSVEGFPTANFSGANAYSLGLQALAAAPKYRSNCFIGSLGDAVNWQLQLVQGGTETVLGSTSGALAAFQNTRILDVFATLGLAGDYSDVRAVFSTADDPAPAIAAFCTLETSSNGSADFRVAKRITPEAAVTQIVPWAGATVNISGGATDFVFDGATANISLGATSTVTADSIATLQVLIGGAKVVDVAVCYQNQLGPGPVLAIGASAAVNVLPVIGNFTASGSIVLPAGNYKVGFCIRNTTTGTIAGLGLTAGAAVVVTP